MFRSTSLSNRYDVSQETVTSAKVWEQDNMYRTSYFKQTLRNSTEQLMQTRSKNLKSISSSNDFSHRPVQNEDFINYDYNNMYRTSYRDMSTKEPKLLNTHFLPKYTGLVPGMKAENPFGMNLTQASKAKINDFNKKRFNTAQSNDFKVWQYNPLAKTIGQFSKNVSHKKTLENHDYTGKLKNSGYSINHYTLDQTGWVPDLILNGDQVRTEYRIQFNTSKPIHYKGPLFSTGQLRKKESNYKHS